jgi:hypothetical protein
VSFEDLFNLPSQSDYAISTVTSPVILRLTKRRPPFPPIGEHGRRTGIITWISRLAWRPYGSITLKGFEKWHAEGEKSEMRGSRRLKIDHDGNTGYRLFSLEGQRKTVKTETEWIDNRNNKKNESEEIQRHSKQ